MTQLNAAATLFWLPDLYVINTANSNGFLTYTNYKAYVWYTGLIAVNIGLIGKLRSDIAIKFEFIFYLFKKV